jgi:hypothetical protein
MLTTILDKQTKEYEAYLPDEDERDFILKAYKDFEDCRNLKTSPQSILGNRTLNDFWNQSEYDYNVLTEDEDINDPITPYASSITRDKANTFISNLTLQLMYPSVAAQNQDQEIDNVISKVSRSILEWAHDNDGRPSKSGHKKMTEYVHKKVVQGTVHVQDDVIDGRLVS